jgi:phosphonoacetaldehyde hydrolase
MSFPIKAVVFDWAGTMIDFGCMAPVEALRATFGEEGVELAAADARRDMGRAKRDHLWALLTDPTVAAAWNATKAAAPSERDLDRLYARLEVHMRVAADRHADLIPGAVALVADLRSRGVKIGSCTGYTRPMMTGILPRAAEQGYAPDALVCAGETISGRPSPLMLWQVLIELDAWPAWACVKIDDAEVGIGEGRAAGSWTIGVAASGNGVGLSLGEYQALGEPDRRARISASERALRAAGADFVVDSVADVSAVIEDIAARIAAGGRPSGGQAR